MKHFLVILFALLTIFVVGCERVNKDYSANDYLRIHIRANSNSVEDQNIKYLIKDKVVEYFSSFDPSIIGFNVEVLKAEDDEDDDHLKIDAVHKMMDSNQTGTIPLQNESAGTLKMFALYPLLQDVLANGGVFFVDELNARLHPLLVRSFIITFLNHFLTSTCNF